MFCLKFLTLFLVFNIHHIIYATNIREYSISNLISCYDEENNRIDNATCQVNQQCKMIDSSSEQGTKQAFCTPYDKEYCYFNSDCHSLGTNLCARHVSDLTPYVINETTIGICMTSAGTADMNPMSDLVCKALNMATGNIARGATAIIIVVIGVLFFTGKVSWNGMLASGLGVGAIFGAPSLAGFFTGGSLRCSK